MESFLNIEDILKKHHLDILHQTRTHRDQREEYSDRLKEAKAAERLGNNDLMEGSYLSVKIIEARNLKSLDEDNSADPFVKLTIEG